GSRAVRHHARARGAAARRGRRRRSPRVKTAATVALRAVPRAALALPPAWRRRLAMTLALLAGLAVLYVGWFRDSSFAKVHDVYVSGLSGPQSRSIRASLEDAGLSMTTLH